MLFSIKCKIYTKSNYLLHFIRILQIILLLLFFLKEILLWKTFNLRVITYFMPSKFSKPYFIASTKAPLAKAALKAKSTVLTLQTLSLGSRLPCLSNTSSTTGKSGESSLRKMGTNCKSFNSKIYLVKQYKFYVWTAGCWRYE